MRAGINSDAYTGIKMLYQSKKSGPIATSTYCAGVNRKKTQNRVRWSPRRVGVMVMNSRSAQNDTSPNSTTAGMGLAQNRPNTKIAYISHHARIRRFSVLTTAAFTIVSGCLLKKKQITLAATSSPSVAPISHIVGTSR